MLKTKGKKNPVFIGLFVILLLIIAMSLFYFHQRQAGQVMVVSVSTDGNYAITTDLKRNAILWDLKNKTHKKIFYPANIYSAYFIKNTNDFMFQDDKTNDVIIENTSGKIVKKFNPGFPTYGQVMTSNLENYFGSDEDWNFYKLSNGIKTKIMWDDSGFFGAGKLLNFSLSANDAYILTGGSGITNTPYPKINTNKLQSLDGVTLWNVETGKAVQQYFGNAAKIFATLSPDGNTVVAGDEGIKTFVWSAISGEQLLRPWNIFYGKPVKFGQDGVVLKSDATGMILPPEDFQQYNGGSVYGIFSLKFIDDNHYLRFTTYVPNYAILYSITDPKPLKYLSLGHHPKISVDQYIRDQSIDTSPKAHLLVTGKINAGGILVYKYSTQTQTLKKIWNGK